MARWGNGVRARRTLALIAATAGIVALAASPAAAMRSEKVAAHLCKTVRGGRFVPIPGFPGERIDRRLLPDIRWMKRRFDIFITDGYSRDPVHAGDGGGGGGDGTGGTGAGARAPKIGKLAPAVPETA